MSGAPAATIRSAGPGDAAAVATLHAASWRVHYRGALTDLYLDGPIFEERLAVWTERLARPAPNQRVCLAVAGRDLLGFVCLFLDDDPVWGTLIDNLHVAVAAKREGLGRRLMREAGVASRGALPGSPMHLYVLEANTAAQHFYAQMGGTVVERTWHTEPDGSSNPVLRIAWISSETLIAATSA